MCIDIEQYSQYLFNTNDKLTYVADHAIIRNVSTQLTKDSGRILENIAANILLSENSLFYYSGKKECDFVATDKNKKIKLYQVCADLNQDNFKRETEGRIIHVIPLWRWLLNKNDSHSNV